MFLDDVQDALDEAYAEFGAPAQWTPIGGQPAEITVMPDMGDRDALLAGLGARVICRRVFRARAAEIAVVSVGTPPTVGDVIVSGGETLKITGQPDVKDPRRLEWTLICG